MSITLLRNTNSMKRDKFISNLKSLKDELNDGSVTFRELKAIYFSINLDYIRLCEVTRNGSYFPSRNCDLKMRECTDELHFQTALNIALIRIDEIINSLV